MAIDISAGIDESIPSGLYQTEYAYDYPEGLDLRPTSELHKLIVTRILNRATESRYVIQNRYDSWNTINKSLTAFIDPGEVREKKRDPRKKVTIIVPMTYANTETVLSYMVAVFLQDPIFRYSWRSPGDVVGSILMEKVVNFHVQKFKMGLNIHTMLRDSLTMGCGVVSPYWYSKMGYKRVNVGPSMVEMFGRNIPMESSVEMIRDVLYEGNKLDNIDPYTILPDPNVPLHDLQEGEFFGFVSRESYPELLCREVEGQEGFFNVKYLKHTDGASGFYNQPRAERQETTRDKLGTFSWFTGATTRPKDVIYMWIRLIPSEWRLGASDMPEKWFFALGGDKIVIMAKPLALMHDLYPAVVCAPDFDGYSPLPISRAEISYGMQDVLDFLFTSHMDNVSKAINDSFIVDPSMINMQDLKTGGAAKLIRLRRSHWGRGVENAIKQLQVTDVTSRHITDSSYVIDIMQRVNAAADMMQGVVRKGSERRTATEARNVQLGASQRLERAGKVAGMQAMLDLGYMLASHTQQILDSDTYVNVLGEWEDVLRKEFEGQISHDRVKVTPNMLNVDYDLVPNDGSAPGGDPPEPWVQLFQVLTKSPELAEKFDIVRVFKHIARILGAKNVENFEKKIKPDEDVAEDVRKGDIAPVEEVE